MSIGQRIKQARKEAGLTQAELAKKTNLSRSYIGDLEIDRYNPSINTLESIAKAVNVPSSRLMGEELPNLNIDSSKGLFQNLGMTKNTISPTTHFDDPEVEAKVRDMMNDPDYQAILYTVKDLSKDELKDLQKIIELYAKKYDMK